MQPARPLNEPPDQIGPIPVPAPADDAKTTEELIQRLGKQRREQPTTIEESPSSGEEPQLNVPRRDAPCVGQACASGLKEDPAMMCYRRTRAKVVDARGVAHGEDLFTQLGLALGIGDAAIGACGAGGASVCQAATYDCSGTFYDVRGVPMRVPAPPTLRAEEELKRWKMSVEAFYQGAYVDAKGRQKLAGGMVALCTNWAAVFFRRAPDQSLLQAFTDLQQMGAEQTTRDAVWIDRIIKTGAAQSCLAPPLLSSHDSETWLVPAEHARTFLMRFRDCAAPDVNGVGVCPHAFSDGNHVNARFFVRHPGHARSFSGLYRRPNVELWHRMLCRLAHRRRNYSAGLWRRLHGASQCMRFGLRRKQPCDRPGMHQPRWIADPGTVHRQSRGLQLHPADSRM